MRTARSYAHPGWEARNRMSSLGRSAVMAIAAAGATLGTLGPRRAAAMSLAPMSMASVSVVSTAMAPLQGHEIRLADSDRAPRFLLAGNTPYTEPTRIADANAVLVLRQRIDVDFDDTPIQQALRVIAEKAGLHLAYGQGVLADTRVQLKASSITVAGALTEVLMGSGLDVLLTPTGQAVLVRQRQQATGSVIGHVTDGHTGASISGATVVLMGTPFGATTDEQGAYRIASVPAGTYTVQVRRLGYNQHVVSKVEVHASSTEPQGVTSPPTRVDVALDPAARVLEQMVVTGTVIPTERKALPNPITVISAKQIDQMNLKSVDEIFRTMVPGGVQSEESPGLGGYASFSVRGTSSIGQASSLKVLVDGIEVTDPAYIKNIDPAIIDHIEVISGPQASTIYGSGAISGVMQIFTKRGQLSTKPVILGKASLAAVDNKWNPGVTPLEQDHALTVTGGSADLGYSLGGSYQELGAWTKFTRQQAGNIFGGGHMSQGPVAVDLTMRYRRDYDKQGFDPLERELFGDTSSAAPLTRNDSRWSTYGIRVLYNAFPNWQHVLTVGYDAYNANGYPIAPDPDTHLYSINQRDQSESSVGYNTTLFLPAGEHGKFDVTVGADFDNGTQTGFSTDYAPGNINAGQLDSAVSAYRSIVRNAGYFAQGQLSWRDQYFLTAGIHADQSVGESGTAWSPRVGLSYVHDFSVVTFKARASYGSALVSPTPDEKSASENVYSIQLANPDLLPNRQRGFDTGIELYWGNLANISLTYYDQTALNLIELLQLAEPAPDDRAQFQYQNIGRIRNRGWESAISYTPTARLALNGTFGSATSTLEQISPNYDGDYQQGDELNDIPKWTAGLTAVWTPFARTSFTGSLTHRATWRETDFKQLFSGTASGRDAWIWYPAYTKFNLGVTQDFTRYLSGFVQVDNVGNSYAFERINLVTPMGRVTTVGIKVRSL